MEQLSKATEARHVSGESLTGGGTYQLLHEAVKLKPGLHYIHQDVEDAGTVGYLLRKSANKEWDKLKKKKREMCCNQQS